MRSPDRNEQKRRSQPIIGDSRLFEYPVALLFSPSE
jgi:hypothetical protein